MTEDLMWTINFYKQNACVAILQGQCSVWRYIYIPLVFSEPTGATRGVH